MTSFDRFSGNYADRASLEQVTTVTAETVPPGGDWLRVLYRDKTVRLTTGYYYVYSDVTLESDYQILGAGDGTVIEIPDGIKLTASGSNIRVMDVQVLDSSSAAEFPIPVKVEVASGSDSVSFQNVTFTGPNCGFLDAGKRTKLIGCRWYAPEFGGGDSGPVVDITGDSALVTGCHAFAGGAPSSFVFLRMNGANNCRVIANIWDNESGALTAPVSDAGTGNFVDYKWVSDVEETRLLDTPWDDLVVSPTSVNLLGPASPATYNNTYASIEFPNSSTPTIQVVYQMPHGWAEGTDAKLHLHWAPSVNGSAGLNAQWGIRTSWAAAVGGTIENITTATETTYTMPVEGTARVLAIDTILSITPPGELGLSSLLTVQIQRLSTDVLDTYTGSILVKSMDIHIRKDTIGSEQEYVK